MLLMGYYCLLLVLLNCSLLKKDMYVDQIAEILFLTNQAIEVIFLWPIEVSRHCA